jgi:hypothetical protein
MRRIALDFAASKALDITLLILVCIAVASNWYSPGWPEGHDAIGVTIEAENIGHLLHRYGGLLSYDLLGDISAFDLNPMLLHYALSILADLFTCIAATKIVFLLLFIFSAVLAYCYVHELTKNRPGSFIAALAYIFAPCFLIEVVFEGHWTVGAGYALTPLLFLATEKAMQDPKPGRIVIAGLSLALLIAVSHPQTFPLLVGPFWVLYVALRVWQSGKLKYRATATAGFIVVLLGLSLTAFWWLPLLREVRYLHAPYSSMDEAAWYSANLGQALTLRPILCCAGSSAYGESGDLATTILQTLPFVLALLGAVANLRNRYVWIFSALAILSLVLASGPSSPNSLFWFAHSYVPFFKWIRTPSRFLLFASLAYAVLIGFCTKAMLEWLKHLHLRRFMSLTSPAVLVALVGLVIVGNTWHEAREAFSTIRLPSDTENGLSWLADRQDGDYRIADASFETEAYYPEAGTIVNPTYWVFAHGKETEPGGMPQTTTYAADTISYLREALVAGKVDMSEWLNILDVKYAVVDKSNPLNSNVILNDDFELAWSSDNIDIYENHNMMPMIFAVSLTNERPVDLWSEGRINASWADGSTNLMLSLETEYARSRDRTLKTSYSFTEPGPDSTSLAINVEDIDFSPEDAIHLVFYSETAQPDISFNLNLCEQDGSRYGMELYRTDGIKAGWNEINFPTSLLTLRDSTDENNQLDLDQIQTLEFGPAELGNYEKKHGFSLYLDAVSVVTQATDISVEYTKKRPGKYMVHVNIDSPSYLVLSESYHPYWVAHVDGKDIHSQMMYECLNSFYLEPGGYEMIVEFTTSPLRIAANLISGLAALLVCSTGVFLLLRRWRQKRQDHQDPRSS